MNSNEETTRAAITSRRKFVWALGGLTLATAIGAALRSPGSAMKNLVAGEHSAKDKTVTMLTQDGRLVEIDASLIKSKKTKVTNYQLQNWIKRDK
jgi:hypothetical protein